MLAQNMTYMRKREAEKKATRRAMAKAEVKSKSNISSGRFPQLGTTARPGDSRWRR